MSVSSSANSAPSVVSKDRSLALKSATTEERLDSAEAYAVRPGSDAEILLRVELAAVKAEAAGARAYGKALEQQMAQMSQSFAEKLFDLQEQIGSYEEEVAEKSSEIESLERGLSEAHMVQEKLMGRLHQTTDRLEKTRALMDETGSVLNKEFFEIRHLRDTFQHRGIGVGNSTPRTLDIHKTLDREGRRQQSLKARLQKLRASNAAN